MTAAPSRRRRPALAAAAVGVEVLRAARTAAYLALGPLERGWRALRGRPALPPLWLRRHVGPVGEFERAARAMGELVDGLGVLKPGDRVVDLGCGCGGMVGELARRIGADGSYLGIDVHAASIRWCRRRHRGDRRLRFERAPVRSPYGGRGGAPAGAYRLPLADGTADLVLAKSLFTHLLADDAAAYLREIRRVLAPAGSALVTAFLFDGDRFADAAPPAFRHPAPGAPVRHRLAARPSAAVAYEQGHLAAMAGAAGLTVAARVDGFFPGTDPTPRGQDVLVLRRARGGAPAAGEGQYSAR